MITTNTPSLSNEQAGISNLEQALQIKVSFGENELLASLDQTQAGLVVGASNSRTLLQETKLSQWDGQTVQEIITAYGIEKAIKKMQQIGAEYLEFGYSPYGTANLPSTTDTKCITQLSLEDLQQIKFEASVVYTQVGEEIEKSVISTQDQVQDIQK